MSASMCINAANKDQIMQAAYRHILANPSEWDAIEYRDQTTL